ncbi:Uncharacterised protein [Mycobacteroides abscessus subsp. abscessus]|nr:Uncharacterised protein [Mycobacteroides abscessus subsp. abscessus]
MPLAHFVIEKGVAAEDQRRPSGAARDHARVDGWTMILVMPSQLQQQRAVLVEMQGIDGAHVHGDIAPRKIVAYVALQAPQPWQSGFIGPLHSLLDQHIGLRLRLAAQELAVQACARILARAPGLARLRQRLNRLGHPRFDRPGLRNSVGSRIGGLGGGERRRALSICHRCGRLHSQHGAHARRCGAMTPVPVAAPPCRKMRPRQF